MSSGNDRTGPLVGASSARPATVMPGPRERGVGTMGERRSPLHIEIERWTPCQAEIAVQPFEIHAEPRRTGNRGHVGATGGSPVLRHEPPAGDLPVAPTFRTTGITPQGAGGVNHENSKFNPIVFCVEEVRPALSGDGRRRFLIHDVQHRADGARSIDNGNIVGTFRRESQARTGARVDSTRYVRSL